MCGGGCCGDCDACTVVCVACVFATRLLGCEGDDNAYMDGTRGFGVYV